MIFTPIAIAASLLAGSSAFNRELIVSQMQTLTSVEFQGRLTLAPGERAAAEYLASEFRRIGLQPGGEDGTFFHTFDITVNSRPTRMNLFTVERGGERITLTLGEDFVPVVGSAHDKLVRAQATFVGFGINNATRNDYTGFDLRGRIAIMLRGVPEGAQPVASNQKARWAKDAGAVGVVFVGPTAEGRRELPTPTRGSGVPQELNLAAAGITRQAFERVTGLDFEAERARREPVSKELPITLRMVTGLEPNRGRGTNVIGVLPGTDPNLRSEVLVIGAHYDHLGFGEIGSRTGVESIHYGADDNASGTVGVLALAEHFASVRTNRRTLIFHCYSGEEVGLVGASAWVRDNPDLIRRTTLMLNMDMIGRLRETVTIFGCSSAKELNGILDQMNVEGLREVRVQASPPNSDHAPFVRAGVPVLFFHTNLHPEYHTERDTFDTINIDGMIKVLEGVRQTLERVDTRDQRLTFDAAAAQVSGRGAVPARPRRVRVGFVPDMSDAAGPGVRLTGVMPDSPAQKAGVKEGDRVLKFGDREITSLEDLQQALMSAQPNVKVIAVILRGDQRLAIEILPTPPGP